MTRAEGLHRDERGAIMVCGLFFCVLCVSAVYYLWSISEVIRYRERVQDAADLAAFSGAVVHARGMNLIALFNMVMAALLAILVALRLVQLLCWFAIGAITAVGWMTGGALYSTIPPLQQVSQRAGDLADKLKDPVHGLIKALHKVGDGVAKVTPLASVGRSVQLSHSGYDPDVLFASPIPFELTLPVESDEFDVLCKHAGIYAGKIAMFPFEPILPDSISEAVSEQLGKLTQAGSGWFCGEEGASPPSLTRDSKRKVSLPGSPARERCMDPSRPVPTDGSMDPVCLEATLQELASQPDMRGECREGEPLCPESCAGSARCPPTGTACKEELRDAEVRRAARRKVEGCEDLEWRYGAARAQCRPPSAGGKRGLRGLWWLQQQVRRTYEADGLGGYRMVKEEPVGEPEVIMLEEDEKGHPCGDDGKVGKGWQERGPACESEARCETPQSYHYPCKRLRGAPKGTRFVERLTLVQEIVHCIHEFKVSKEERKQQAEAVDVGPEGDDEDEALAPFKLEEGVWLGDDRLQLRALAWGNGPNEAPFAGVRLAAWGQSSDSLVGAVVDTATAVMERLGAAQGEYYFHADEGPLEMGSEPKFLWKMGWRARLRPLRFGASGLCKMGGKAVLGGKKTKQLRDFCSKADRALSGVQEGLK